MLQNESTEQKNNMKFFITGSAGFIGSSLTEKLLLENNCVIGIDNFDMNYPREIKENNIKAFKDNPNFTFYYGDIRDKNLIEQIMEEHKPDVVIHLAAKAGVRASLNTPLEYVSVNIEGTVNIIESMRKNNINKLIFASSSSVYGNCKSLLFKEEETDYLVQISPYACSKKACEDFIRTYTEIYDIQAVCLRFFTVYGPKQRPDLAICKFTNAIMKDEPVTIYGCTSTYRDYTYIDDITDGICAAVKYDKTKYEIINLGSSSPVTLKELIEYIEEELGKKAIIEYLPKQTGDVERTYADITKAKNLLGYSPKLSFKQGLHKFVKSIV